MKKDTHPQWRVELTCHFKDLFGLLFINLCIEVIDSTAATNNNIVCAENEHHFTWIQTIFKI
jgi:hypothetical protein